MGVIILVTLHLLSIFLYLKEIRKEKEVRVKNMFYSIGLSLPFIISLIVKNLGWFLIRIKELSIKFWNLKVF